MPDKICCEKRCIRCWRNHMKHCTENYDNKSNYYKVSRGNTFLQSSNVDLHNELFNAIRYNYFEKSHELINQIKINDPTSLRLKELIKKLEKKERISIKYKDKKINNTIII